MLRAQRKERTMKEGKVAVTKYSRSGSAGGLWFMGFLGTLIYFLHYHSGTFLLVLVAIVKAIFWPAYLVYYLLSFMGV
jgi:hypothetical protein